MRLRAPCWRHRSESGARRSPTYHQTARADHGHRSPSCAGVGALRDRRPVGDIASRTCRTNRSWAVVRFTFGDTQYVDYMVTLHQDYGEDGRHRHDPDLDTSLAHRVPDNSTVTDPDNIWTITSTSGKWEVWPMIPNDTTPPPVPAHVAPSSRTAGVPQERRQGYYEVTGGGEVACNGHQRGNFGQLDSPRADSSAEADGVRPERRLRTRPQARRRSTASPRSSSALLTRTPTGCQDRRRHDGRATTASTSTLATTRRA